MLSRVADSLYWMSRYLERAENTVRQLDVTMSLMLDPGGASAETRWQRLLASIGKPTGLEWNGDLESMARALVFDGLNPEELVQIVDIQLNQLDKRLAQRRLQLEVSLPAKKWLAHRGFDPVYGARPLRRLVQQAIGDQLAKMLLAGDVHDGDTVPVNVSPDGDSLILG